MGGVCLAERITLRGRKMLENDFPLNIWLFWGLCKVSKVVTTIKTQDITDITILSPEDSSFY